MKTIELSLDIDDIKNSLEIDDSYNKTAYDNSAPLFDLVLNGIWFILYQDNEKAGIINLKEISNVMWMSHIIIYEKYRKKGSEQWGIAVALYMNEKLGAKKILAITPYENAKKYAERMGMKQIGMLNKSIQKDGELLNQYILEMELS